ncbi:recombination and DNA strand exchange inhibitor protein [Bacillus thuringiensis serovar monterrey BGSC 4AJ1]|nr:recombination and DNA strand exchange inhibitor protein [Bacillus thuringiensis serovar monterrey BGSC 4AJ1]
MLSKISTKSLFGERESSMSGILAKFSYKQLHAMKHAVLKYMQRDGITEDDSKSEQALLLKINYLIEQMKERNNIGRQEAKQDIEELIELEELRIQAIGEIEEEIAELQKYETSNECVALTLLMRIVDLEKQKDQLLLA